MLALVHVDSVRFASMVLCSILFAVNTASAEETRVDMATTDVLAVEAFRGEAAELLGLHLGMSWDEAKAVCDAHPRLVWKKDDYNPGRAYVEDAQKSDGGDPALFYLQWPDGRKDMGRMVIYGRAKQFVPAGTASLLDARSLKDMPADVRAWLGDADRSVVTLDIQSIGLKHTTHVFERRGIEVIDHVASDSRGVYVALALTELLKK
jgi:hypothetical protein